MIGQNEFASTFRKFMRRRGQDRGKLLQLRRIGEKVNPRRLVPQPREFVIV